jgi:sulfite exporter TauE/SafE
MLTGLMFTAFLMGLGGVPHCAAMCGSACAVAFPRGVPLLALLGRCLGYALLGAVAAASASLVASWGRHVAVLQPFWILAQATAVVLGLVLLARGRLPAALDHAGQSLYRRIRARAQRLVRDRLGPAWMPVLSLLAGMGWAALPCGLLYAALMVAVLAPGAWEGALVMACFAVPGAGGVWAAPALLAWLGARRAPSADAIAASRGSSPNVGSTVAPVIWLAKEGAAPVVTRAPAEATQAWLDPRWAVRASGLCLSAMALWGLSHHLLAQWRAWCA